MDPLRKYKQSVEDALANAELVVQKSVAENSLLRQSTENKDVEMGLLREQVAQLQREKAQWEVQRGQLQENEAVVADFFSHLCNVQLYKSPYEDEQGLWFNVTQTSAHSADVSIDYKLGFVRGEDTRETEIVYIPLLKELTSQQLVALQDLLPDYMFDTLSFPLKSLNQFYIKMFKCLNKK